MHPRRHAHAGVVARARIVACCCRRSTSRGPSADPSHASARRLAPSPRRPNRRRERAQPVRRPPGRRRRRVREVPAGRVRRVRPRIRLGLVRRRRRRLFSRRHSWRGSRGRRGRRLARGRRRGVPRGGRGSERREHRERPAVAALTRGGARRVHPPPSRARGQRRRRVDRSRRRRRSRRRPRTRIRPQGGGARRGESKVEGRHAAAADVPRHQRPVPPRQSGRHLCVVLDLDETLVCAYNHEANGGVPPELSTPEAVAKTTRFTLHKDPRGHTRSHTGTLGLHADAMTAPGEPVPLVASTTAREPGARRRLGEGDWRGCSRG